MNADYQRLAFEQSRDTAEDSTRCLLALFALLGFPKSMLDVGCGAGHLVRLANRLGIAAIGLDLHVEPGDNLYRVDFTKPWLSSMSAHWVLCWEVAEHLPPAFAPDLCFQVAEAVQPGGFLFFTAAQPGQGGAGHLNEQSPRYWSRKLTEHGLEENLAHRMTISAFWRQVAPNAWWYAQNLLVFRRPS